MLINWHAKGFTPLRMKTARSTWPTLKQIQRRGLDEGWRVPARCVTHIERPLRKLAILINWHANGFTPLQHHQPIHGYIDKFLVVYRCNPKLSHTYIPSLRLHSYTLPFRTQPHHRQDAFQTPHPHLPPRPRNRHGAGSPLFCLGTENCVSHKHNGSSRKHNCRYAVTKRPEIRPLTPRDTVCRGSPNSPCPMALLDSVPCFFVGSREPEEACGR
jgi:hypothetical protein